jgi:hypothetical protein
MILNNSWDLIFETTQNGLHQIQYTHHRNRPAFSYMDDEIARLSLMPPISTIALLSEGGDHGDCSFSRLTSEE